MKKSVSVILCLIILLGISACSAAPKKELTEMSIACIKGPTGIGMAQLMNLSENSKAKGKYKFSVVSSADEISAKIVSGEINIASVPTNLAAKLYNKTQGKITMLAVNTLGVLSILENGSSVKSVSDLKGKTIYSIGEGSNPEYILRHILTKNGINPDKDVKIQFVASNDELASSVISGKAEIAMAPEPVATKIIAKKKTVSRALSINDEWEKISDSGLMMGCVVALKSYAESNASEIENFLEEYRQSINYANENVAQTAAFCEKYEIIPSSALAQKAIPECNLIFSTGAEMQNKITGYFEVLYNADKTSIGGKIPNDDFFFKGK
ncbi:MAG: ABC transporter substrate-binding protein [Ruminococcus sp.]|nr:ABC transporter substrate-binding protein [Candidatus Copronaster equi]